MAEPEASVDTREASRGATSEVWAAGFARAGQLAGSRTFGGRALRLVIERRLDGRGRGRGCLARSIVQVFSGSRLQNAQKMPA
ncbi:MAG: hypothetical protein K1X94_15850 [Sandaracinaceae bacterium]|nr:hypothetical protein [Sandaracinaceae bacterium]